MINETPDLPVLVRERAILAALPVSRATWRRWIQEGKAPKPIPLTAGISVWSESEIRQFIETILKTKAMPQ